MMKVAIIGFAREGQAAYEYWNKDGNEITICDRDADKKLPADVKAQLGEDYLNDLERFDIVVRTAGLHPGNLLDHVDRVTTSADEFMRACPTRNIIGVTGTKGKGTTSVLISKMLEAAGYRTHLGGNIGTAPLKLLKDNIRPDDWVVLELSSFQLIDIKSSPHIAVCVMMAEEHINWHEHYAEYIRSKQQLFRWQKPEDIAIYYGPDAESKNVVSVSPGKQIPYMQPPGAEVINDERIVIDGQPICHVSEIKLLGKHNWQNICAAATAFWQVTHDTTSLRHAIVNMSALPNHLEPLGEKNGVQYFNDSFSSTPGSTAAALDAVTGTKVLIVGGFDKGLDLTEMINAISSHKDNLRKVLLIGAIASNIANLLQKHGFSNYEVLRNVNMKEIVQRTAKEAEIGDTVLFSPGSSSFDMFRDIGDRGNQFIQAVRELD